MAELWEKIISSIVGSGIGVALVLLVSKTFVERWVSNILDAKLKKREERFKSALDRFNKMTDFVLEQRKTIYQEIKELVHRIKKKIEEGLKQPAADKWDPSLKPLWTQLEEDLFRFSLVIDKNSYAKVHEFKNVAKQISKVIEDIRPFDKDEYQRQKKSLEEKYRKIETLFEQIDESLRKVFKPIPPSA